MSDFVKGLAFRRLRIRRVPKAGKRLGSRILIAAKCERDTGRTTSVDGERSISQSQILLSIRLLEVKLAMSDCDGFLEKLEGPRTIADQAHSVSSRRVIGWLGALRLLPALQPRPLVLRAGSVLVEHLPARTLTSGYHDSRKPSSNMPVSASFSSRPVLLP